MPLPKARLDESRTKLWQAMLFALGSYMDQEGKKDDGWRDVDLGQLYNHLRHEVDEEIRGNLKRGELSYLLHNAVDAVSLSAMLLARVMEVAEIKPVEEA